MNLYRGCQHGCIYCDSRSDCFQIENFSEIEVKENAVELLQKELATKKKRGTIGFGSMNDPYMPIEKQEQLTQKSLEVINKRRFPIHIITKSDLVLRDIDIIEDINQVYSAITFSIISTNDRFSQKVEPSAPSPTKRLKAMEALSKRGIYTGVALMPALPYITDTVKNTLSLIEDAANAGAQYIMPCFGLTLRDGSREYFLEALEKLSPEIKEKYVKTFGQSFNCNSPKANYLYQLTEAECTKRGIKTKMDFYKPNDSEQLGIEW